LLVKLETQGADGESDWRSGRIGDVIYIAGTISRSPTTPAGTTSWPVGVIETGSMGADILRVDLAKTFGPVCEPMTRRGKLKER